jgi:hypothetical protein
MEILHYIATLVNDFEHNSKGDTMILAAFGGGFTGICLFKMGIRQK